MSGPQSAPPRDRIVVLGDEAVALAAADAGITAAYAYPGTPSTEILEYLIRRRDGPRASWCANEKTAYEAAIGLSMAGRRALVAMKHVGLNVAADPFINSAVVSPIGGLVLAVADDPGMHSSQNEQDSRFYADFAGVPCLEPRNPQEAYAMTREAFDVSERFRIPVVVRIVTRLAHQRAPIETAPPREPNVIATERDRREWVLLPAFSRRQWKRRIEQRPAIEEWAALSPHNELRLADGFRELGVITTGLARTYFDEVTAELGLPISHLHIGAYPIPRDAIRELARRVDSILVIEEGYPFVERLLRGVIEPDLPIFGRMSGAIPPDGELDQDLVRRALGIPVEHGTDAPEIALPNRPPRLCDGCPHLDAYAALQAALDGVPHPIITSDIGCYTLGALPPTLAGDSCVCMGASIGMAKGASDAGIRPAIAVIGDSTFLPSGVTPLMDAVSENTDMTVLILDNQVVAMTGSQPTLLPSPRLPDIVRGLGVDPDHLHVVEVHPRRRAELEAIFRREIAHSGLSVVIAHRECIEAARKRKSAARRSES